MPPNNVSIVGDQTIVMTDDETISSETPLMNGIYFTSFTSNVCAFQTNIFIDLFLDAKQEK